MLQSACPCVQVQDFSAALQGSAAFCAAFAACCQHPSAGTRHTASGVRCPFAGARAAAVLCSVHSGPSAARQVALPRLQLMDLLFTKRCNMWCSNAGVQDGAHVSTFMPWIVMTDDIQLHCLPLVWGPSGACARTTAAATMTIDATHTVSQGAHAHIVTGSIVVN